MYVGCVSGAVQKKDYLSIIEESGFHNITIQKEKAILIPDAVLLNYLTEADLQVLKESGTSISSITVYAEKQSKDERNCCEPGSGCC
jgi:hypothetical protein